MGDEVYPSHVGKANLNLVEQIEERQHSWVAGFRRGVQLELLQHLPEAESATTAIPVQAAG